MKKNTPNPNEPAIIQKIIKADIKRIQQMAGKKVHKKKEPLFTTPFIVSKKMSFDELIQQLRLRMGRNG